MCGASMKKRWVRLTPGLVEILCKIPDAVQFEQATQADVNIHMDRVKKEEGYDPRQQKLI